MCLHDSHRWRSADTIEWLRIRGLHSVPNSIKADIGDLVYNGPSSKASDDPAVRNEPPGRFVFSRRSGVVVLPMAFGPEADS